eukprot:m.108042 g.108042  ORF g.108042 m.108042 type:complete len:549 (+) comp14265_c0_seq1:17-1663(+)
MALSDQITLLREQTLALKSVAQPSAPGLSHVFGETNLHQLQFSMEKRFRRVASSIEKFSKSIKIALPGQLSAFSTSGILEQQLKSAFNIIASSSFARYANRKGDLLTFLRLVCNEADLSLDAIDSENFIIAHPAFFVEVTNGGKDVKITHADCPEVQESRLSESFQRFDHTAALVDLRGLVEMYTGADNMDEYRAIYLATGAFEADLSQMTQLELSSHSPLAVLTRGSGLIRPRACGVSGRLAFFLSPYHQQICSQSSDPVIAAWSHAVTASITVERWPGLPQPLQIAAELASAATVSSLPHTHAFGAPSGAAVPLALVLLFNRAIPMTSAAFEALLTAAGLPASLAPGYVSFESLLDKAPEGECVKIVAGATHRYRVQVSTLEGLAVRRLPLARAAAVPAVLQVLRRQLILNSLYESCVSATPSTTTTTTMTSGIERIFDIKLAGPAQLLVTGQHPSIPALLFLQISVSEDLSIHVVFVGLTTAPPCQPARLAALLEKSHSIPLAWALLHRVAAETSAAGAAAVAGAGLEHTVSRETVKRKREEDDE